MSALTVPLDAGHDRLAFFCGADTLDTYFRHQAGQDMRRRLAVVFVLPGEGGRVKGFYTLSNDSVPYSQVPLSVQKKMPASYTSLPTTLLGRLAVDREFQGRGLGELLLLDALKRSYGISTSDIGSIAVVVDPMDDRAAWFYRRYGFIMLADRGRMFIPVKTIARLFRSKSPP